MVMASHDHYPYSITTALWLDKVALSWS